MQVYDTITDEMSFEEPRFKMMVEFQLEYNALHAEIKEKTSASQMATEDGKKLLCVISITMTQESICSDIRIMTKAALRRKNS